MGQSITFQPTLSEREFEALSESVLLQARRLDSRQMLDLADELHDLIRSRQAARARLRSPRDSSSAPSR